MAQFTLEDAKKLSQSKLTNHVIDEFRKSPLMDRMVYDDCVKPQGGDSLTYVYNRVTTYPTAEGREINKEYENKDVAKTTQITTNLKIFGGAFDLDRVLINHERQVITNQLVFQMDQKVKAVRALFNDWFVNGDSETVTGSFDGLNKAIKGTKTDFTPSAILDMSSAEAIEKNWKAFLYYVRQTLKLMDGTPDLMAVNNDMFAVFQTVADYSSQFTATKNELGSEIVKYGNTVIMKMGDKPGKSSEIIETSESDGTSPIYFARLGLDGVHAVTPDGQKAPKTYLPNLTTPGAVKTGEVEMIAAMVVKATKSAAVLRGIKVAPI
ncbi:MAG: phage capsid protein [Fusicatenibacter sp.]|nr:phage capsid protein [Fusicatenibacter sp.]